MVKARILIVDDHRYIREMLTSAINTMGENIDVINVPSAEEGLLEVSLRKIDLLVCDYRLPGISGLELKQRLHPQNPDMKFILITGVDDTKVRRQIAESDASAYFFKPLDIPEFLEAVKSILEEVQLAEPYSDGLHERPGKDSIANQLANLRQDLNASSVSLVNDDGAIAASAGDLQGEADVSVLIQGVMETFSSSIKIAHFLGTKLPLDTIFYAGSKFDLILVHIGKEHALLITLSPIQVREKLSEIVTMIRDRTPAISGSLSDIGVSALIDEIDLTEPLDEDDSPPDIEKEPQLVSLLWGEEQSNSIPEDVNDYWESLTWGTSELEIPDPDALSYEEAKRLGFTPEED